MDNPVAKLKHSFFVAGVNYRTAPVEIRERMAVAHADREEVSRLLQLKAGLSEVVVLWTCNRVEVYGVSAGEGEVDAASLFSCLGREVPSLASHVYHHTGREALNHLFRVTAGLDSMVMGETQITGQVRDAYEAARKTKLAGKVLNSVFQTALRAAKAVRTKTSIGRGARSVGGLAVAHAQEVLGEDALSQHKVLMIGAGEMAECCLRHLQKKGQCEIVVANRSVDRAQKLAAEFKGTAVAFDERYNAMADADVVISSTGSASTVIHRSEMEMVMQARANHPLMLIDIAVPRDIDPDVTEVAGVHLHDIDALESTVRQTLDRWEEDLEVCGQIVDAEIDDLFLRFKRRHAAQNARHDRAQRAAVAV